MKDFFTYLALFSVATILVFLLRGLYLKNLSIQNKKNAGKNLKKQKTANGGLGFVRCPLCNTPLAVGEDLFSRIFRPMTVSDQRMYVLGCPHCYPDKKNGVQRICPVCRKNVPVESYLIARLFNKTSDHKKHVIITGCPSCCGPKKIDKYCLK